MNTNILVMIRVFKISSRGKNSGLLTYLRGTCFVLCVAGSGHLSEPFFWFVLCMACSGHLPEAHGWHGALSSTRLLRSVAIVSLKLTTGSLVCQANLTGNIFHQLKLQ